MTSSVTKKIKNKAGLNSPKKQKALAKEFSEIVQVKMSSTEAPVSSLSGGNQQKVCIAKCLLTEPEIIFIDEPTIGIDVKTKAEIHKIIYNLANEGRSIVLISSDMAELIQIAERIQVFRDGRIVGEIENNKDYDSTSARIMERIL